MKEVEGRSILSSGVHHRLVPRTFVSKPCIKNKNNNSAFRNRLTCPKLLLPCPKLPTRVNPHDGVLPVRTGPYAYFAHGHTIQDRFRHKGRKEIQGLRRPNFSNNNNTESTTTTTSGNVQQSRNSSNPHTRDTMGPHDYRCITSARANGTTSGPDG